MTSPDTSAAEVVAYLVPPVYGPVPTLAFSGHRHEQSQPLVLKSTLDTSRAEAAAANARADALERDLRDALAVAEPWHKAYETQLARADALADLLDSNVSSLGKQLADEGRAREAAEAERAKAVDALTALADSADSMGWSVNSGLADDAINNARRALAEIEGKSK